MTRKMKTVALASLIALGSLTNTAYAKEKASIMQVLGCEVKVELTCS